MSAQRPEIERVLRFITENLERPLGVAELAREAHLSEFHFQRVFHAAVGESVGRFVTRQRLELAALRLSYALDRSITDIALSSGYSSSSNFSKAFQVYFGCSPSQVRSPDAAASAAIGKLTSRYGKDFRPGNLYTLPNRARGRAGAVGREWAVAARRHARGDLPARTARYKSRSQTPEPVARAPRSSLRVTRLRAWRLACARNRPL